MTSTRPGVLRYDLPAFVGRGDPGAQVEQGLLVVTRGGNWAFSYAPGRDDDEDVYKLAHHKMQPGEYITITEHDGEARTFRVVSVQDWHPAAAGHRAVH